MNSVLLEAEGRGFWITPDGRGLFTTPEIRGMPYEALLIDWLKRHGVPSGIVPLTTVIVRDMEHRQVLVRCYVDPGIHIADGIHVLTTERRAFQLESPPLPFPPIPEESPACPVAPST